YEVGAVFTSVTGLPESFDGTQGAAEFDTADAVHGFLRMNGTTLGIFCKRSIQALNGTDNTNFSLSILEPYEGACEYTIVDMGGKAVYASYKGISTFDQTSSYGAFLGGRLSRTLTPWLQPRLQNILETNNAYVDPNTSVKQGTYTPDIGPLFAMPI